MSRRKTVTFAQGTQSHRAIQKRPAEVLDDVEPYADIATSSRFGRKDESQGLGLREAELSHAPAESLVHEDDPGFTITAFNLDDELNEGHVDVDAGFIPTSLTDRAIPSPENSQSSSDNDASASQQESIEQEEDEWADNATEQHSTAPAYQVQSTNRELRPSSKRQRIQEAADGAVSRSLEPGLIAELCELLRANETAMGALRRLKKTGSMIELERVTELCDRLMAGGDLSIYEMDREAVLKRIRWTLSWGRDGACGEVHGPFDTTQMLAWSKSGFFSHPDKVGWVRAVGTSRPWLLANKAFGL
jgi:GYF domain